MSEELIRCTDLTVGYENCRLCGKINFAIHEGEYMCIVGHSGIGKSALISTLLGVEKPIDGKVEYKNGLERVDIGCMPQEPDLRGSSVVRDIVISGCIGRMKHIFVAKEEKECAMQNLERLGVADLARRRFGDLSGGQKQRVLLARALCGARRLLILDEPMRGLDAFAQDEMYEQIVKISRDDKIAVMIVDSNALDGTVLHLSLSQLFCGPVDEYCNTVPGKFYFAGRII